MDMAGLQSLATELLQEIFSLVSGCNPSSHRSFNREEAKALCDIRSICKFINAVVEPTLFRHLVMSVRPTADLESESLSYMQLRYLAAGGTTASTCAEALTIRLFGERMGEDDSFAPFMAELALALGSLHNVTSVMCISSSRLNM
jgi:hypothetical protein